MLNTQNLLKFKRDKNYLQYLLAECGIEISVSEDVRHVADLAHSYKNLILFWFIYLVYHICNNRH